MNKAIDTLVIVAGPQRAGKTTFIGKLGSSKRMRAKYLGSQYGSLTWSVPKNDDSMCSERLVCGKTVELWLARYRATPLLICHTIRWRRFRKSEVFSQIMPLIALAERVVCFLIFPNYQVLVDRVLENRPEALPTLPYSKTVYRQCRTQLESFCMTRGIHLYVIRDTI
jgi:hypothetical protein